MKTFNSSIFLKGLLSLIFVAFLFSACKKDNIIPNPPKDGEFAMGLTANDDPSKIPSAINLSIGNTNLPSKYDLTSKFPPVGSQGNYGTCVAWAVGYNTKTALNALDHNLSTAQIADKNNITSPAYLWMTIPGTSKGSGCAGTNFEPAMEALIKNGAVSESKFPYESKLVCDQLVDGSMATDAAKNKLESFRKIDISVQSIKTYISENRPVVLGAILSSNFQPWNSDAVLSSHSNEPASQHGRHAMAIVGYDDSKGPNGAFRLVNSWDKTWGDKGFIWVDYNFLVKPEFGFIAFVATNAKGEFDPNVDPDPANGNFDLIPWNVYDEVNQNGGNPRSRTAYYNIYNIGQQTVRSSSKWNMCYIYYNAFNANDYGIILYDSYTNEFGGAGQNGPLQSGPGFSGNWWNNIDIPSGSGMAEELFGENYVTWNYTMPNITGYYYIVAIADAYNSIDEIDEANNFFYLGNENGGPVYIQNGIVQGLQDNNPATRKLAAPTTGAKLDSPRQMSKANYNAYTPEEISTMLLDHKKSGKLQNKIVAHQAAKTKRSR